MVRRLEASYSLTAEQALTSLTKNQTLSRPYLHQVREQLTAWFLLGADTELLLTLHAQIIDQLLINLWQTQNCPEETPIVLLAVGGYGRRQLHLHSDIDIAFIIDDTLANQDFYLQKIKIFMTALWDSHLVIGHSVRSLRDTWQQAQADQTILTNLLETRVLCGNKTLAHKMQSQLYTFCPKTYLQKKMLEYQQRWQRYAIPPYTLEPHIKCSPGGQRDIQMIEWLINLIYQNPDLQLHQVFNNEELTDWVSIKKYLNTLRFALHMQANRANEQLVFDHQLQLAILFNEEGNNNNQAVTHFMRRYFNYTRRATQLIQRALQQFGGFKLSKESPDEWHYPLDLSLIKAQPWQIFELFTAFSEQKTPPLLTIETQRLLDKCADAVPEMCYKDLHYQPFFLFILRSSQVTATLTLMHAYQLLGKYIPLFALITGMMQYDLFHAYPVDQHSLGLLEKLELLIKGADADIFPLGNKIAKQITKPELLYLAGVFHDIGKGQNGRHEDIGAVAVKEFCAVHSYNVADTELVTWLVQNHLLLSYYAQQKDIANPLIIEEFSKKIKDINYLNHLYLLTIADIYATNKNLWTGWRMTLLDTLYQAASLFLTEQTHKNNQDKIAENKKSALAVIPDKSVNQIKDLWSAFNADYFLNYSPQQLAEHAALIINKQSPTTIHIHAHASNNATEIFIYTPQQAALFFAVTSILGQLQLSIVAAQMHATQHNYNLSTYIVLQRGNKPLDDNHHINRVLSRLTQQLNNIDKIKVPTLEKLSRRSQAFNSATTMEINRDEQNHCSLLRLLTVDRQGLLANIVQIFYQENIHVLRTQINTLAERAEDNFWLTDHQHHPLSLEKQATLLIKLQQLLSQH